MTGMKRLLILTAALAPLAFAAPGQAAFDVQTINFDLWCQETQHYPADRCDKRLPDDMAEFEAFRARVEKYEVPYLRDQENGAQLNRVILHNDPVDNPVTQNPSAQQQQPVTPGQRTTP